MTTLVFPKLNIKLFCLFGLLVLFLLLFFYVYQISSETAEKYSIGSYQKKIAETSKENKLLEIDSARLNSLDNIAKVVAGLDFEKTDKIHYIQITDAQVVVK